MLFVLGCLTDYYVAVGVKFLGHKDFPERTYYWCTGEKFMFSQLPASLSAECRPLFDQIQTYFTGEFEKVIVQGNGVSQYVHIDELVRSKVKIPAAGITELDRLSHVVH